jgi:hypothetical protein
MLRILVISLTIAASGALDAAIARDYPFCIMGCDFGGAGYCGFDSYAQCQASASGRDAWCAANPAFPQSRASQGVNYSRRKS